MDEVLESLESLGAQIDELGPRGPGFKYPSDVRAATGAAVVLGSEAGLELATMARAVGLGVGTVRRWAEAAETAHVDAAEPVLELVPVTILDDASERQPAPEATPSITVALPSGVQVSGLRLAEAMELVERFQ